MKRILFILSAYCLFAVSCGKDKTPAPTPVVNTPTNPNIPNNPSDSNHMRYTVNGVTDLTMERLDEKILVLGLTHSAGKQERINLSIVDVPSNVTAVFETPSGTPSFATKLTVKTSNAAPGVYNMVVKAVSESDSVKQLKLVLTVKAPPPVRECADEFTGNFNLIYDWACTGNKTGNAIITKTAKDKLTISNLGNCYSKPIQVDIMMCGTPDMYFEIPLQSDGGGVHISGMGGYNSKGEIEFEYAVSNSTTSTPATAILKR